VEKLEIGGGGMENGNFRSLILVWGFHAIATQKVLNDGTCETYFLIWNLAPASFFMRCSKFGSQLGTTLDDYISNKS